MLVIFGSVSDSGTYNPIIEALWDYKINYSLRILSAHKTPKELDTALHQSEAKIVIAGAGLAAALPGAVASTVVNPVIGVPSNGSYEGLDALLSIHQMPPGVPVLGVGVNQGKEAVRHVHNYLTGFSGITLIQRDNESKLTETFNRCEGILRDFGIKFKTEKSPKYSSLTELYVDFVPMDEIELVSKSEATVIVCPVAESSTKQDAMKVLNASSKNLWVGLNNGANAALGAIQLLNFNDAYSDKLIEHRVRLREQLLEIDKKEGSKA
ncbi:MAG: AIR carboxylase family protein [Candidatus Diapherotrites archaeon]